MLKQEMMKEEARMQNTMTQQPRAVHPGGFYGNYLKRLMDIFISLIALILVAPMMLTVAILVKTQMGSPVLFRQTRVGYKGQLFEILKFRTMTDERDTDGNLLPDEKRLKPLGIMLRKWSLDELPQLVNVLRGDISLVGPRPLLTQYLDLYTKEQFRRHDVKPGVTGLAQVNGRNTISWEQKFDFDVQYVDNMSPWMDFQILLKTAKKLVRPQGISQQGHATMEYFQGTVVYERPERLDVTDSDWKATPRKVQANVAELAEQLQRLQMQIADMQVKLEHKISIDATQPAKPANVEKYLETIAKPVHATNLMPVIMSAEEETKPALIKPSLELKAVAH